MKYQLAKHTSLTQIEDEAVLLDLDSGRYYGLNHVGARFLEELVAQATYESALSTIAQEYQIDQRVVSADLKALLDQLLEQRLIEQTSID